MKRAKLTVNMVKANWPDMTWQKAQNVEVYGVKYSRAVATIGDKSLMIEAFHHRGRVRMLQFGVHEGADNFAQICANALEFDAKIRGIEIGRDIGDIVSDFKRAPINDQFVSFGHLQVQRTAFLSGGIPDVLVMYIRSIY